MHHTFKERPVTFFGSTQCLFRLLARGNVQGCTDAFHYATLGVSERFYTYLKSPILPRHLVTGSFSLKGSQVGCQGREVGIVGLEVLE